MTVMAPDGVQFVTLRAERMDPKIRRLAFARQWFSRGYLPEFAPGLGH